MSFELVTAQIQSYFKKLIKEKYGEDIAECPISLPPKPELGDLALALSFQLAKSQRKAPPLISKEIAEFAKAVPFTSEVRAVGPYVNIFLNKAETLQAVLTAKKAAGRGMKVIVEHTNINPNKAAHIGHLRNSVLGDTLVRMLRVLGYDVETQNYIDDTGVQVADVVVGFQEIEKKTLADVQKIEGKFDFYCWDLYTQVGQFYEKDKAREKLRQDTLLALEHGGNKTAELAEYVAKRIVNCHIETMWRIGIQYDVLPRESAILKLKFWQKAFELLKEKKAVYLAAQGKNKDCWVMLSQDKSAAEEVEEQEKVIVRSNGTITYVGKDIAYQMWKFGLLGNDFNYYKLHTYPNGKVLWDATSEKGETGHPSFAKASKVYNVIDNRQAYLQKIVKQGLLALGHEKEAQNSVHFSYEMVALTPQCAKELGLTLSAEDQSKSFVEMSGRKGLGVKADDLLDRLFERCKAEVSSRNSDLSAEKIEAIAHQIGVGALRYFMLKHGEIHVLSFDFDQALAFEGETGPYLQNALVRASSILRKLEERKISCPKNSSELAAKLPLLCKHMSFETWEFLLSLMRIEQVLEESVEKLQLSSVAKYAFSLAQRFHAFYHHNPIAQEEDLELREMRIFVVLLFIERMVSLLDLMGIAVPERM